MSRHEVTRDGSADHEATPDASAAFHAHAYGLASRTLVAALVAAAGASLPALLVLVLIANDPPVTPPLLARLAVVFTVAPYLAAWVMRRVARAHVTVGSGEVVVRRRGLRVEVPGGAIAGIVPWVVPLPGPGFWLRMRSGARLRYGLEMADPEPLLVAMSAHVGMASVRAVTAHPTVVYAHAKESVPPTRWYHLGGKFVAFALLPTAVFFNAHQHIAYGGPFGEYYLLGLASYLATFAAYWGTLVIYLVLFAGVLRGLAESASLAAAWVASPARALAARRAAEAATRALYYGGVPLLVLLRFLP